MLEKALAETDPETTDIVVMTAKVAKLGETNSVLDQPGLDMYDQQLMTAVVERAEKAGKQVRPLIVPTNNPLHAILQTAKDLQVHELVMGASNKYTADEQLEQIAFYWISLHHGNQRPADGPYPDAASATCTSISTAAIAFPRSASGRRGPWLSCARQASASTRCCWRTTAALQAATCSTSY